MMVGRHVSFKVEKEESKPGKTILKMENVLVRNNKESSRFEKL